MAAENDDREPGVVTAVRAHPKDPTVPVERPAADETIAVAYDEYTESLEAMGVNPKPVC